MTANTIMKKSDARLAANAMLVLEPPKHDTQHKAPRTTNVEAQRKEERKARRRGSTDGSGALLSGSSLRRRNSRRSLALGSSSQNNNNEAAAAVDHDHHEVDIDTDDYNLYESHHSSESSNHTNTRRRGPPRRTKSVELEPPPVPRRGGGLQRTKSADGSSLQLNREARRNMRINASAQLERSVSIRRLGLLQGAGEMSSSNSRRPSMGLRAKSARGLCLEKDDSGKEEQDNQLSTSSQARRARRRSGSRSASRSPLRDGSVSMGGGSNGNQNASQTTTRRGSRRQLMLEDASGMGTSSRRRSMSGSLTTRRMSGRQLPLKDHSSGDVATMGSSSRRTTLARRSSSGSGRRLLGMDDNSTMDASNQIGASSGRRRGVRRANSGMHDDSSNRRRTGVARSHSGMVRRRQTLAFVETSGSISSSQKNVSDKEFANFDNHHENDGANDSGSEYEEEIMGGSSGRRKGMNDVSRRRKEPTLSKMSINDLRDRLCASNQNNKHDEDNSQDGNTVPTASSTTANDDDDIWNKEHIVTAPLESNLND